jgi:hypothetical protein
MDRYLGQHSQPVRTAVDDETAAYILETRLHFEDLRQVAAQIAGLLVLAAAGSSSAGPYHPMLTAAVRLHEEASDALRSVRVPEPACDHHAHLRAAATALANALAAAQHSIAIDPVLAPLRAAYDQLQQASNELPGFPMVTFEQACCAIQL